MKRQLLAVLLIGTAIGAFSQSTNFRDSRWFNPKSGDRWYRQPIMEASSVTVTTDSVVAKLGERIHRYRILSMTPIPKDAGLLYKVTDGTSELNVKLYRTEEPNRQDKRLIAWIETNVWVMMVPLKDIDPPGYYFPGDPIIDVPAANALLPGYYKFDYLLKITRAQFKKTKGKVLDDFEISTTKCQEDMQVEFRGDNTGTWWSGRNETGCQKAEYSFDWELKEVVVNGVRQLRVFIKSDGETNSYEVVGQEKGLLELRGEFNLGGDTTLEGVLNLSRAKKK